MNTTEKVKLIDEKINELKQTIATTKTSETLSKNTRSTKLYALSRERRVLHLIKALITDPNKLSKEDSDTFILITTLASERIIRNNIEVNENDKILELMQKYSDVKNLMNKLQNACDKKNLKLDFAKGIVVKA